MYYSLRPSYSLGLHPIAFLLELEPVLRLRKIRDLFWLLSLEQNLKSNYILESAAKFNLILYDIIYIS